MFSEQIRRISNTVRLKVHLKVNLGRSERVHSMSKPDLLGTQTKSAVKGKSREIGKSWFSEQTVLGTLRD